MDALPIFVTLAGRPVLLVGDGDAADAKQRLIEAAGGVVVREGAPGVRLAFVALDEPEAAAAQLKTAGCLVNVVDRPDLCDFTVPAIVDRSPVIVAIGTGGASASLAKALRQRLEAMLAPGLGGMAEGILSARGAIKARFPDVASRRRALDAAMAEGGPLDPLGSAAADVLASLSDAATGSATVTVDLRSDDPDDLSLREARWLARADRLVHAPGVPATILDRARRDAVRVAGDAAPDAPGLTVIVRRGNLSAG